MSDTMRLALPRIYAGQAQKHVTHNEALGLIDALMHLSVRGRNVNAPPQAPQDELDGLSYLGVFCSGPPGFCKNAIEVCDASGYTCARV